MELNLRKADDREQFAGAVMAVLRRKLPPGRVGREAALIRMLLEDNGITYKHPRVLLNTLEKMEAQGLVAAVQQGGFRIWKAVA